MRKVLKHTTLLSCITLLIGFSISFLVYSLELSPNLIKEPVPEHFIHIFLHNAVFIIIYAIPVLGFTYFIYSFSTIFIAIGLVFSRDGILSTLLHLIHLPIELFAFSLIITMGLKIKPKLILWVINLLFVAALIEFYV